MVIGARAAFLVAEPIIGNGSSQKPKGLPL
jgi:hypothetical protein